VEHVALAALIALLALASISALTAGPPERAERRLGATIARRIACGPRIPDPCNRNPLAHAYGFPLGKLVRSFAPLPGPVAGPGGLGLVPVDFRRCRQPSCAAPSPRPGLTTAGRRVTAFTQVEDLRRSRGIVRVSYWLYRPGIGWEAVRREGSREDVAAAARIRLRISDDPALVPLETLPGHNHYEFAAGEQPPWRWHVRAIYP
jgi:hypothetical protein